jgi:hypothetical protein
MVEEGHIEFRRLIPVRQRVDVLVAGGGPAGVAAAITAARQGVSVHLVEGHTCFGGMGTAGLVPAFMTFSDGEHFLAGGIGHEVYERLLAFGGVGPLDPPRTTSRNIRAEVLKRVYDEMVAESGAGFTFQTQIIAAQRKCQDLTGAICAAKSGIYAIEATAFVDCTGDGDLAAWAGAPFQKGDENGRMQPGTLCSLWSNVDWDEVVEARKNGEIKEAMLPTAIADGVFSVPDMHLPGMWRVGSDLAGGNIGHTFGVDGTDERSLTEALVAGRKMMLEYERYYKEYLTGFDRMCLVATGSLLGIRETRRIMGDYVLCMDDFASRAVFEDEIGRYCYPVDLHATVPTREAQEKALHEFKTLRYGKGESYGIPYRSLVPQGINNLLVAGRCLSADRPMQGSVRVMPGCYITGQAAGMAAALMVEHETSSRGIDVQELQSRLKGMGAYLPNT